MPNWCSNHLTLAHVDETKIRDAIDAFKASRFLEHFVPLPNDEWDYDFCVSRWGTKWDVGGEDDDVTVLSRHQATFYFDSAWAPPTSAYSVMASLGFDVTAHYHEPGMAFCGKYVANEDSEYDDYHEYGSESATTVRDLIGEELDDLFGISESMSDIEESDTVDQDLVNELDEIRSQYSQDLEDERNQKLPPHTD